MIPILTLAEMKEVERKTSAENGLSELDMIQSAGEAVFESIKAILEDEYGERPGEDDGSDIEDEEDIGGPPSQSSRDRNRSDMSLAFVCGTGHNGADGLAAALLAAQAGYSVVIYQMPSEQGFSRETEKLQGQLTEADITINFVRSPLDLPVFQDIDLIIDALLGTGTNRAPEGLLQSCIFGMNQSGVPILSVDIPSGIRGDTAEVVGSAVEASATICLGSMKLSSAFYPAALNYGKVGYSPICFDEKVLNSQPSRLRLYSLEDAVDDYPERDYRANKYNVGKVLVIAGSRGMHGAAALSSNSALRSGAGMVKLAYPAGIHSEASIHILEIIGVPIGAGSSGGAWGVGHFHKEHIAEIEPLIEWADSILIGPGLGRHADTVAFLEALVPTLKGKRTVLDGDALSWFKPDFTEQADLRGYDSFVVTPHAGEYKRMGGEYEYDKPMDLLKKLRNFAQARNLNVVLKGATTFLAHPDGRVTLLPVGNPGMATAGSGDVLAGTIAGLLAVRNCEQASGLGVFAHGKAGDLARKDRGTLGLVASDLLLYLPLSLLDAEEGGDEETGEWKTE
ncbi:MAG TPA: NAD(P)H-hydrate dehydratase [Fibrobacteria bacterium]|nr:NAD(P)H-hydrate dehydratase [Fibrobacteria bacterium]